MQLTVSWIVLWKLALLIMDLMLFLAFLISLMIGNWHDMSLRNTDMRLAQLRRSARTTIMLEDFLIENYYHATFAGYAQ